MILITFVFARLSICISLIPALLTSLFPFIDLKHTHPHPDRLTLSKSARCALTLPIYPDSGGLIEIYNDYQMRLRRKASLLLQILLMQIDGSEDNGNGKKSAVLCLLGAY